MHYIQSDRQFSIVTKTNLLSWAYSLNSDNWRGETTSNDYEVNVVVGIGMKFFWTQYGSELCHKFGNFFSPKLWHDFFTFWPWFSTSRIYYQRRHIVWRHRHCDVFVTMYACADMSLYVCVCGWVSLCMCVYVAGCLSVCVCMWLGVSLYVCVCMWLGVSLYVCVCMWLGVWVDCRWTYDEESLPLPIFIHANDVVRWHRFASRESERSF